MRNTMFLGIISAILLGVPISLAANFDAQNSTFCMGTYCETSVNLSRWFNTAQINNIKAINWASALPKKASLFSISYRFDGTLLIIYGSIINNTYWNMGVSTLNIDPWWNLTTSYSWTGVDEDTTASTANVFGYTVQWNCSNPIINEVEIDSQATATNILVYNMAGTKLSNTTITSGNSTVNLAISKNAAYYIVAGKNGASYTRVYKFPYSSYPNVSSPYMTVLSTNSDETGDTGVPDQNMTNSANNIKRIAYTCDTTSTYFTTNFYLNGNEGNISVAYNATVNASFYVNVTGLNLTMYRDGTLLNNSTSGNISHLGNLVTGLYNYTATTNQSDSATTYWVTVASLITPIDTRICFTIIKNLCIDTLTNKIYLGGKQL